MSRIHSDLTDTGFDVPDSVVTASVCRKSGLLAIPGVCDHDARGSAVYTEYFAADSVPTEMCDHHVLGTVCSESGGTPTEFCPEETRVSRAFMILPSNETGATDDSNYIAQPESCTVHTEPLEVVPEEDDATDESSSQITTIPLGPGYRGPGYMGSGYISPNN